MILLLFFLVFASCFLTFVQISCTNNECQYLSQSHSYEISSACMKKMPTALLFYVTEHACVLMVMYYEGLGSILFISSLYHLKFCEIHVFLSRVWVMNKINWLNWLSSDGINYSRMWHTDGCHFWLSRGED